MDEIQDQDLTQDITQTSEVLGKIAEDESAFRLLVQSYRAQDYEVFREILTRFDMLNRCELICKWLCSKDCTLICFELCGPPPKEPPKLSLPELGEMIAKISSNREIICRLAGAVIERDERSFKAIVEKLGIERHRHYICNWICTVRCRLICELLCAPEKPFYLIGCTHLMEGLLQASAAIARLLKDPKALSMVEKGVLERNCEIVRTTLERAGFQSICHWICLWICTWRCVRVCMVLCRPYTPVLIDHELHEIHAFARTTTILNSNPELTTKLAEAVETEDAEIYAELVRKLGFEPFCHQLCSWLCRLVCRRFCRCICPPPRPRPWFTHVGHFHIYGDINPGSGLTNKVLFGHGGPDFGFTGCLELRGFCPLNSPTVPGSTMQYRFLYERGGSQTPLVGSLLCPVIVGSRTIFWDVNGTGLEETFQTVVIAGSGATPDPTPTPILPPGTPWGAPPPHVIVPDVDGWITVDPNTLGAGFNGALIGFNTKAPFPHGNPAPGVNAGMQVPNADLKNGVDVAIIYEATRVGGPVSPPDYSNTLSRIHINNWKEVALLDILQFHIPGGSPCSPLSTDLDIEYTIDHELMRMWKIDIKTAASISFSALTGTGTRNAANENMVFGTHHEDISKWPMCSYAVQLTYQRALTTGLVDDDANTIQKTFCIGRKIDG